MPSNHDQGCRSRPTPPRRPGRRTARRCLTRTRRSRPRCADEQAVQRRDPATHRVRRQHLDQRAAQHDADVVAGAEQHQQAERQPQVRRQAEGDRHHAVAGHGREQRAAGALPRRPVRLDEGRGDGAERRRGEQPAELARAAVQDVLGVDRRRRGAAPANSAANVSSRIAARTIVGDAAEPDSSRHRLERHLALLFVRVFRSECAMPRRWSWSTAATLIEYTAVVCLSRTPMSRPPTADP